MAVIKVQGSQTSAIERVSEGAETYLRALRDGSLTVAGFKIAAVMEGRGFHITAGALSTGLIGGTIVDIDEPQVLVSIPNGTSIMPIRITTHVQTGAPADAEEVELFWSVDNASAGAAISTAAFTNTEVIYNMNTLFARASNCKAYSDSTNSMTDPGNQLEITRKVIEYDVAGAAFCTPIILDDLYEPVAPLIINGPAMLVGYWGGTGAVVGGFAEVEWLEFPSSFFS